MSTPPYTLPRPAFPFPALAAQSGRAMLGGEREVALASFVTARLAEGARAGGALAEPARTARATAARAWLASLALPAATRLPFKRAIDATAADDPAPLAAALRALLHATAPLLDAASVAEMHELAGRVDRDASAHVPDAEAAR